MLNAPDFRFHHLGLACRDLDRELGSWTSLGYVLEGETFEDPLQRVRGCFVTGPGPRLELLAPYGEGSPVSGYIQRGAKLYHQGFEVLAFDAALRSLEARGARLTALPAPAVAFGGRRIAFLMTPALNLIEIIEAAA